jgi:hypothetical protein
LTIYGLGEPESAGFLAHVLRRTEEENCDRFDPSLPLN